jgi:hypothetical protein
MFRRPSRLTRRRRGAIAVLAALLCVILLGMVAFAVDLGYLANSKTQLQATADSAALAAAAVASQSQNAAFPVAQYIASHNTIAGRAGQIADASTADVQFGTWDSSAKTFTYPIPGGSIGNAVRVTVRTDATNGGQTSLFFGRLFGLTGVDQSATAIATMNPRDIAFVVDLSGSMNDDTTPGSASASTAQIQQVYDDFGFGTYSNPGSYEYAGQYAGVSNDSYWVYNLTKTNGYLRGASIPARYKVTGDTDPAMTWKAYAWVMEVQMTRSAVMPNAKPALDAGADYQSPSANYTYWKDYIDSNRSKLGYCTYVKMMMENGRDTKPDNVNYTPLSLSSNLCACPMRTESAGGTSFDFPPREMPVHAMRRALISAVKVIQDCNQSITDVTQRDWVSIITFDKTTTATIAHTLDDKYGPSQAANPNNAMYSCTRLQAVGEGSLSTNSEAGLIMAYNHIKYGTKSGNNCWGRQNTNKIVVLLTDGAANLKVSDSTAINNYKNAHPATWTSPTTGQTFNSWAVTGSYTTEQTGALMQASIMQGNNWYVYAAGVGGACTGSSLNFMNCMARMGATADNNGNSLSGGSDPATYEANVTQIFQNIITNPKLRIVK